MRNLQILPAAAAAPSDLREAMLDAFSDYAAPMRLSQSDFDLMMRQRGLDTASSRIAVVDGVIAAIWLTSVRDGHGYLIASGTRPGRRSQGLARTMAAACLAHLRDRGVASFQTEVLRSNDSAHRLYQSLGMTIRRELDCYRLTAQPDAPPALVRSVPWKDVKDHVGALRDWAPSWQNSDAAISAISEHLTFLASFDGEMLVACTVFNAANGTVHQIAVREGARRRGKGLSLLAAAKQASGGADLRLINVDGQDAGFGALMRRAGAEETIGQYELYMAL